MILSQEQLEQIVRTGKALADAVDPRYNKGKLTAEDLKTLVDDWHKATSDLHTGNTGDGNDDAGSRKSRQDQLIKDRGEVYGDPRESHCAIAMAWAPLLKPHEQRIANMRPLPEHTIAQMMAAFKLCCRSRLRFKQDNYDDMRAYIGFAEEWQEWYDHANKSETIADDKD